MLFRSILDHLFQIETAKQLQRAGDWNKLLWEIDQRRELLNILDANL